MQKRITITQVSEFLEEIISLGGEELLECYQCGSCTAICPITEEFNVSFRKTIKYAQFGLRERLLGDLTPWLCNVHGDCVESCPRDAKPSKILATIRRYQSIYYDWTGVSRWWNFSSLKKKLALIIFVTLLSALGLFVLYKPVLMNYISMGKFINMSELIIPGILIFAISSILLLSNAYRMYKFIGGGKDYKVGFFTAIKSILRTWLGTEKEAMKIPEKRSRILEHILIFIGLGLFIILSLPAIIYPSIYSIYPFNYILKVGRYVAAITLLIGVGSPIIKRISRSPNIHWYYKMFRHSTDWASLITVFSIALTGLLLNIFNDLNMVIASYITYVIHLGLVFSFLLLEVPFGKHNHWIYRAIANYVSARKGILRGVTHD